MQEGTEQRIPSHTHLHIKYKWVREETEDPFHASLYIERRHDMFCYITLRLRLAIKTNVASYSVHSQSYAVDSVHPDQPTAHLTQSRAPDGPADNPLASVQPDRHGLLFQPPPHWIHIHHRLTVPPGRALASVQPDWHSIQVLSQARSARASL